VWAAVGTSPTNHLPLSQISNASTIRLANHSPNVPFLTSGPQRGTMILQLSFIIRQWQPDLKEGIEFQILCSHFRLCFFPLCCPFLFLNTKIERKRPEPFPVWRWRLRCPQVFFGFPFYFPSDIFPRKLLKRPNACRFVRASGEFPLNLASAAFSGASFLKFAARLHHARFSIQPALIAPIQAGPVTISISKIAIFARL
jgi:hypothetical protein